MSVTPSTMLHMRARASVALTPTAAQGIVERTRARLVRFSPAARAQRRAMTAMTGLSASPAGRLDECQLSPTTTRTGLSHRRLPQADALNGWRSAARPRPSQMAFIRKSGALLHLLKLLALRRPQARGPRRPPGRALVNLATGTFSHSESSPHLHLVIVYFSLELVGPFRSSSCCTVLLPLLTPFTSQAILTSRHQACTKLFVSSNEDTVSFALLYLAPLVDLFLCLCLPWCCLLCPPCSPTSHLYLFLTLNASLCLYCSNSSKEQMAVIQQLPYGLISKGLQASQVNPHLTRDP
jgi:hypothetical protein